MNAPIAYDKAENGYFYEQDYDMPLYSISEKDGETLAAAELLLSYFKNTPVYEEACAVIDLLSQSVVENGGSDLRGRIALAPTPKAKIDKDVWNVLCRALKENAVVEFDYAGRWNTETEKRVVEPYQIVMDNGSAFLFGFAKERKAERLFSLNRIRNLKITDKTFKLPKDFEFESRCGGGKFGAFKGGETARCTVKFFEDSRELAKDCIWADDQKITEDEKEGSTTITFTSTQTFKVLEWVLSQGKNAVPVEPAWMVEDWKEHVKEMGKRVK
ncbi:MAG: WYL domain-containing protein [Fibrobacteraceae bacterium]|nr:WYL domain-containing protein [Fibrobacteraceae bacterium]